jgi:hypothetical protein
VSSRERPGHEVRREAGKLGIGASDAGLAEGEDCSAVAVVGAQPADPFAIDRAEVPEAAARRVERVFEEAHPSPGTRRDRRPAQDARVEQVDLERAGHVVDAVPVRRVGPGPDCVLLDPDRVGQLIEMPPGDGMKRGGVRHGRPPTAQAAQPGGRRRRPS